MLGESVAREDVGLFGPPLERVRRKILHRLDEWLCDFIACSPFVLIASVSAKSGCTISPRGGAPGFVRVLAREILLVPDYSGNRLFETARNVRKPATSGLLFMIPGCEQVARVTGVARTSSLVETRALLGETRQELLDPEAIQYFVVDVRRAYYHCGRAIRFAGLWDTARIDSWKRDPKLGHPSAPKAAER